jgi:hypothetical protein
VNTNSENQDRQESRPHNRRLAKKRVQCFNDALCFVSSSVLADSLVLRNPLLRQAPKRYIKLSEKFIGKHGENLQFCRSLENLVVFRNY